MKPLFKKTIGNFVFTLFLLSFILPVSVSADALRMSKEELKPLLGKADVTVIDVRRGKDWSSSEFKIQGAERVDPGNFSSWADKFPKNNTLVLYCA